MTAATLITVTDLDCMLHFIDKLFAAASTSEGRVTADNSKSLLISKEAAVSAVKLKKC